MTQPPARQCPHVRIMELQKRVRELKARNAVLEEAQIVPGVMRCPKCELELTRTVLFMGNGVVGAGDNKTEPCPNGCGPLWPVTWERWAKDAIAGYEKFLEGSAPIEPPQEAGE